MNTETHQTHHVTAPEDRVPFYKKILYGSGSFADQTWQWGFLGLALPIFNVEFGFSPILIGIVLGITRVWDSVTDPLMGSISDNTRTRFGRRRPYIAVGAVLAGFFYSLIWFIPEGLSDTTFFFFFLILVILFYTSFTIFSVPFYALGYEMSPDYHERTRMMGVRIWSNSLNGVIFLPWIYWLIQRTFWDSTIQGVKVVGVGVGVLMTLLALLPAITIKERAKTFVQTQKRTPVIQSVKYTLKCKPFVFLILGFFCAIFSMSVVSSLFFYPTAYYVFGGNLDKASLWIGIATAGQHITTLCTVGPISYISRKLGKRRACMTLTLFIAFGSIVQMFCYIPTVPWLLPIPFVILGIGWTGFWVLIPAMIADVVDYDEHSTGTRREGMFGAVHFWVIKFGLALALVSSGFVLAATGFHIDFGVDQPEHTFTTMILLKGLVTAGGALIAIYFISRYSITEKMSYDIRAELESRRGVS
jgi:GPH family glycoside/pentoside/hexuronide:cation symporter